MIEPYQFHAIKHQVYQLVRTYQSVNDPRTIKTVESMTKDAIEKFFPEEETAPRAILTAFFQPGMTISRSNELLAELKEYVRPFQVPTTKQIEKMFRKVKKLKVPDFASVDLKETTYLAWDDIGSQSKFMIIDTEQGFTGLHGNVSTEVKKGICPLCQQEGNVSMFLSLTKSNGDGTYTKRGNYICRDSQQCNQQLEQPENLHEFVSLLQMKDK